MLALPTTEVLRCGKDVLLYLEVNAESKSSWTCARSAAKKLLADCEALDKAMREHTAENLTRLANDWLSRDEENPRNPVTNPSQRENLPADQHDESFCHLQWQLHRLVQLRRDVHRPCGDSLRSLKKDLKAINIEG